MDWKPNFQTLSYKELKRLAAKNSDARERIAQTLIAKDTGNFEDALQFRESAEGKIELKQADLLEDILESLKKNPTPASSPPPPPPEPSSISTPDGPSTTVAPSTPPTSPASVYHTPQSTPQSTPAPSSPNNGPKVSNGRLGGLSRVRLLHSINIPGQSQDGTKRRAVVYQDELGNDRSIRVTRAVYDALHTGKWGKVSNSSMNASALTKLSEISGVDFTSQRQRGRGSSLNNINRENRIYRAHKHHAFTISPWEYDQSFCYFKGSEPLILFKSSDLMRTIPRLTPYDPINDEWYEPQSISKGVRNLLLLKGQDLKMGKNFSPEDLDNWREVCITCNAPKPNKRSFKGQLYRGEVDFNPKMLNDLEQDMRIKMLREAIDIYEHTGNKSPTIVARIRKLAKELLDNGVIPESYHDMIVDTYPGKKRWGRNV